MLSISQIIFIMLFYIFLGILMFLFGWNICEDTGSTDFDDSHLWPDRYEQQDDENDYIQLQ